MIRSMTGFGSAKGSVRNIGLKIECRSINSKGMDLNLRIPSVFREKEQELRQLATAKLDRGKIDISLYAEQGESQSLPVVDQKLIRRYHKIFRSLPAEIRGNEKHFLNHILRMPDVLKLERQELLESDWKKVVVLLGKALLALDVSRMREGKLLGADLKKRISIIGTLLQQVDKLDTSRLNDVKERLTRSVEEKIEKSRIDQNRFEQELIYYLEKLDITEEKVRLKTHLAYFLETLNEKASGKKLGFISQEIGREINTIGSKANHAPIQKLVVAMKDELEKIKEQLNNVL